MPNLKKDFELVIDNSTVITPCVSFTLFLDGTDEAGVKDFYQRAQDALPNLLTHYITNTMSRRTKINQNSEKKVLKWIETLPRDRVSNIMFHGCGEDKGISSASIELTLVGWPPPNGQTLERRRSNWRILHASGPGLFLPLTKLRVTLPLEHSLSLISKNLLEWVSGFKLVTTGETLFGTCGLGVNFDEFTASSIIRPLMMQRLANICNIWHGTEWNLPGELKKRIIQWDPAEDNIVIRIPRVSWLTLLGIRAMNSLKGGVISLQQQSDQLCTKCHFTEVSCIIQAGSEPTYGDPPDNSSLLPYRSAASLLGDLQMRDSFVLGPETPSWVKNWQCFLSD
jgi:hypothetical protein